MEKTFLIKSERLTIYFYFRDRRKLKIYSTMKMKLLETSEIFSTFQYTYL